MAINHNKSKNRIVDILLDSESVFDKGKTVGKLRAITVGQRTPDPTDNDNMYPFAFVTNGNPILITKLKGIVQDNKHTFFDRITRYRINFVASRDKATNAELQLDNIEFVVSQALEANFQLLDPKNDDDPICNSSVIERVDSLIFSDNKGKIVQGRTITLMLTLSSS